MKQITSNLSGYVVSKEHHHANIYSIIYSIINLFVKRYRFLGICGSELTWVHCVFRPSSFQQPRATAFPSGWCSSGH